MRVVARAAKVPVVGGALLITVGRALGTVHVEDERLLTETNKGLISEPKTTNLVTNPQRHNPQLRHPIPVTWAPANP